MRATARQNLFHIGKGSLRFQKFATVTEHDAHHGSCHQAGKCVAGGEQIVHSGILLDFAVGTALGAGAAISVNTVFHVNY